MELTFKEQLVLLAINDKGWFRGSGTQLNMNLAAVSLHQLLQSQNIRITDEKVVVSNSRHNDAVMIDLLAMISASSKPRLIKAWIGKLSKMMKPYRNDIIEGLIRKKVLKQDIFRLFWMIPLRFYPLADRKEKQQLIDKVAKSILYGNQENPEMMFLGSMVLANYWERFVFAEREQRRKVAKLRKQITGKFPVSAAMLNVVQSQHQSAVVVTSV